MSEANSESVCLKIIWIIHFLVIK